MKGHSDDPRFKEAIRDVYKRMDTVLGEALEKVGPDTAVLVLSDHGFDSFRRAVHVNSWLRDHGFLVLKDNAEVGEDFLQNVDWSNTRAYSVGFGGIYINQFGREKNGIVYKGAETEQVKKEIAMELTKLKDANGAAVVKKVYTSAELYQGPYAGDGPDLFIGFDRYYRASWQSGLGAAPKAVIENNDRLWGGDHLCDPTLVPGVLFSNLPLKAEHATLLDIGPTILKYFGLSAPDGAEGHPLN
jgi:predicted AlkP superfamily phosphohydrolase/phosphomutase